MGKLPNENNFSSSVKKSIMIKKSLGIVWKKISNISDLSWLTDVKNTTCISKTKHGVGAIRNITFKDGNQIEEHVVAWENKKYFSYVAVTGLPLRIYHATISINPQKKTTRVTWEAYLNSKKMTKKEFNEFVSYLREFYQDSLNNLKSKLEK